MKTLLGLLTLVFVLAGCSLFGSERSGSSSRSALLGDAFNLEEGRSVELAATNATLRFVEKAQDSRCPIGVDCIWEGEAKVVLAFTPEGQATTTFEMVGFVGPEGGGNVTTEAAGYRFTLERLDPYPEEGVPDDGPATARLMVARL